MNDPANSSSRSPQAMWQLGPVLLWSCLTSVVVILVIVTQIAQEILSREQGLHLESDPPGARVFVDGVEIASKTPCFARTVGWKYQFTRSRTPHDLRIVLNGEEALASLGRGSRYRGLATSAYDYGWTGVRPDPVFNGALWVERPGSSRVWLPRAGRALCGVGLFGFDSSFRLDGVPIEEHSFGPDTSRHFGMTLGLDLEAGEHRLEGSHFEAVIHLQERTAAYLAEANPSRRKDGHERITFTLPPDQFPTQRLTLDDGSVRTLEGLGPHAIPALQARLDFVDQEGRKNRIEVRLQPGKALWIRAGVSP